MVAQEYIKPLRNILAYIKIIKIDAATNIKAKSIFWRRTIIMITQTFIKNPTNGGIPAIDKKIKKRKTLSLCPIFLVFIESFLEKL